MGNSVGPYPHIFIFGFHSAPQNLKWNSTSGAMFCQTFKITRKSWEIFFSRIKAWEGEGARGGREVVTMGCMGHENIV